MEKILRQSKDDDAENLELDWSSKGSRKSTLKIFEVC